MYESPDISISFKDSMIITCQYGVYILTHATTTSDLLLDMSFDELIEDLTIRVLIYESLCVWDEQNQDEFDAMDDDPCSNCDDSKLPFAARYCDSCSINPYRTINYCRCDFDRMTDEQQWQHDMWGCRKDFPKRLDL